MNIERALKFLAAGLSTTQVASIIGVTPARISQLRLEQKDRLEQLSTESAAETEPNEDEILSNRYLATEHALLKQMESQIPYAELRDCTNALRVVSDRQEKRAARHAALKAAQSYTAHGAITVSLTLPIHAVPEIKLNEAQEIIEIEGQAMAPLSSDAVRSLFQTRKLSYLEPQNQQNQQNQNLVLDF